MSEEDFESVFVKKNEVRIVLRVELDKLIYISTFDEFEPDTTPHVSCHGHLSHYRYACILYRIELNSSNSSIIGTWVNVNPHSSSFSN